MLQTMPVYYSAADPFVPMSMVTAADVANAQPVTVEQIAQFLPTGVPQGFVPMLVHSGAAVVGSVEPTAAAEPAASGEGATKQSKKDKKSHKKKHKK